MFEDRRNFFVRSIEYYCTILLNHVHIQLSHQLATLSFAKKIFFVKLYLTWNLGFHGWNWSPWALITLVLCCSASCSWWPPSLWFRSALKAPLKYLVTDMKESVPGNLCEKLLTTWDVGWWACWIGEGPWLMEWEPWPWWWWPGWLAWTEIKPWRINESNIHIFYYSWKSTVFEDGSNQTFSNFLFWIKMENWFVIAI